MRVRVLLRPHPPPPSLPPTPRYQPDSSSPRAPVSIVSSLCASGRDLGSDFLSGAVAVKRRRLCGCDKILPRGACGREEREIVTLLGPALPPLSHARFQPPQFIGGAVENVKFGGPPSSPDGQAPSRGLAVEAADHGILGHGSGLEPHPEE
ncbi:hypothetical protein FKM82_023769 [Ascaphus truei]